MLPVLCRRRHEFRLWLPRVGQAEPFFPSRRAKYTEEGRTDPRPGDLLKEEKVTMKRALFTLLTATLLVLLSEQYLESLPGCRGGPAGALRWHSVDRLCRLHHPLRPDQLPADVLQLCSSAEQPLGSGSRRPSPPSASSFPRRSGSLIRSDIRRRRVVRYDRPDLLPPGAERGVILFGSSCGLDASTDITRYERRTTRCQGQ